MSSLSSFGSTSSRCRQWRIQLGVFPRGDGELTPAQERACLEQTRAQYRELALQYPYPADESAGGEQQDQQQAQAQAQQCETEKQSLSDESAMMMMMDPLTALMMEEQSKQEHLQKLDLQYRKERARRKRGASVQRVVESEEYDETAVTLQIIDKDLHRLPPSVDSARVVPWLRQVLFVYHCTSAAGYRQGMHEIASHLLQALEQDDDDDDNPDKRTQNEEHRAADTYALLCAMLEPILPAFDCNNGNTDEKQPLVALGRRILQLTGRYHPALLQCLQRNVQVPPQLYLTKWIRLLYSRELQDPEQQILPFWDVLFHLAASASPSPTSSNHNLLTVLEAAAAARLFVHAPIILGSDDALHYLMNVPPQTIASMEAWQITTAEILQGRTQLTRVCLATTVSQTYTATTTTTSAAPPPSQTMVSSPTSFTDPLSQQQQQQSGVLSVFSASLKQTLEQAKTKTQSLSKRIYQEFEHAAATATTTTHVPQPHQPTDPLSSYNVFYREEPPPQLITGAGDHSTNHHLQLSSSPSRLLYDPPVFVGTTPTSSSSSHNTNYWQVRLQTNTAILQSYLVQLQQHQQIQVPPNVWQAMAEMQAMAAPVVHHTPSPPPK